jgi:hypothetical protein
VDEEGAILAQSGGFSVTSAYDGENPNVYIDTGEDVTSKGLYTTIAVQNAVDGQAPSLNGEAAVGSCGREDVDCAPEGTEDAETVVVAPRDSTGMATTDATRKRFYVYVTAAPAAAPTPAG